MKVKNTRLAKPLLLASFMLIFCLLYWLIPQPTFTTDEEAFKHIQTYEKGVMACERLSELIVKTPNNPSYQYLFQKEWSQSEKTDRVFLKDRLITNGLFPDQINQRDRHSTISEIRDGALFGIACSYFFQNQFSSAELYIDSISNNNHPGLHFLKGQLALKSNNQTTATNFFLKEIERSGMVTESWDELLRLKPLNELEKIKNDHDQLKEQAIPSYRYRHESFSNHELFGYIFIELKSTYERSSRFGLLAVILIFFTWFLYLKRLHRIADITMRFQLLAFIGGTASIILTQYGYDLYWWELGFEKNGSVISILFDSVLRIGLIEESSKLVPVIILAAMTSKQPKSPFWFVGLAAMSGLGFSLFEDMLYFESQSLHIISSRSLIAGGLHMAWSSLAVYGFVQYRYRTDKKSSVTAIPLYFFTAVVLHGIYDFWLFIPGRYNLYFMAYVLMIISIILWVGVLNNCLNNSNNGEMVVYDSFTNYIALLISFSSIILLEFAISAMLHGASNSLDTFYSSSSIGLFAIPFLAYGLSNLDIAPGGWQPIYRSIHKSIQNPLFIVGKEFSLKAYRRTGPLSEMLPLRGEINRRICLSNDNQWYLFCQDLDLAGPYQNKKMLLIKNKDSDKPMGVTKVIVHVRMVDSLETLQENETKLSDFKFLGWGELVAINKP